MDSNKTSGAITGAVIAAAAQWGRYDDDTQRRLRNVRADAEGAIDMIRDAQSRGEAIRARLPIVADAQVGIAIANSVDATPGPVPSQTAVTRPDLSAAMESSVGELAWPPQPGQYDARGMVKVPGELTAMFLAQTFEEVRAFVQGLAQSKSPGRDGKVQVFYAANSLVATVAALGLKYQDYKDAWARVFGVSSGVGAGSSTTHTSTASPPSVSGVDPGIISIKPLGMPDLPLGYEHQNTDSASKWRISIGGAAVNTGTVFTNIIFGQPYFRNGKPYQPVVSVNDPRFLVTNVTPNGFQLACTVQLFASGTYDIGISVTAGCC
jgi:hypothetical protein